MFTHLHVASGYSLRYGASTPVALVETAVEHGMTALALTDRDGLYGAVKFVRACRDAGLAPLLGVDLAVAGTGLVAGLPVWADPTAEPPRKRVPVRGGASVDARLPRVTVLALGAGAGRDPALGWGRLCRLVSATHLRAERGRPVTTTGLVARHAHGGPVGGRWPGADGEPAEPFEGAGVAGLMVLLGPDSEVGRAVFARRDDLALAALRQWQAMLPSGCLAVEVVCHHGPPDRPTSLAHAAHLLALARTAGVPAVLSNAVRYATADGAVTVDVLDAARRLVPLDARHVDRVSAQGYLAPPQRMVAVARAVAAAAGAGPDEAARLLADTEAVAQQCRLDPAADLGLGSVHLPEPSVLELSGPAEVEADLYQRCFSAIGSRYPGVTAAELHQVEQRLADELRAVNALGFASYFVTVAQVCELIRGMQVRVAARGSGAGSLVNYLLRISGVDPIRHHLLMERFLSPRRAELPDIDLDVESARRPEVYQAILNRFGSQRVSCVSMMDTYRVRHAVRDVGAALGLPPAEVDAIATAFPHIRARDVRHALTELPELAGGGLTGSHLDLLFDLVERLDGLPRHIALHPCGVILSDAGLLNRTPVEASWVGFPMSQFDKDDVEELGLLKLDVLGIRMQSAMAYAITEVARVDQGEVAAAGGHDPQAPYLQGDRIDLDAVPLDDEATYRLIRTTHTLGCFQIESPGQRELIGKFGPESFTDLVIDISLFRPGPVQSDMITPFLRVRQGWDDVSYLDDRLKPALVETCGVVVFHEQVLQIFAVVTGCELDQADEARRAMGSPQGQAKVKEWVWTQGQANSFDDEQLERIWQVLEAFASFGFCRAHAAAFALPTYQSAWLKTHHPAAFLAGVLTHDPGMYPKRLILDDARSLGIAVLGLDVNVSRDCYQVEKLVPDGGVPDGGVPDGGVPDGEVPDGGVRGRDPDLPDGSAYGIRVSLTDVKGISEAEVARIMAGQPYRSLPDFWHRAQASRPVVERLVLTGAFDAIYGLGATLPVRGRGRVTRRDLLLQTAELDRWTHATQRSAASVLPRGVRRTRERLAAASRGAGDQRGDVRGDLRFDQVRAAAARQGSGSSLAAAAGPPPMQLALDLGDAPDETVSTGLPELTGAERVRAELEVLGLDVSRHVVDFYTPLLTVLGTTRARDLMQQRYRSELLVAGVKVATQTPPIRSGRRVVFLTLDDATGPVDATFFEDVQGPYAATVFHSWLLLVRGVLRRTGPRGVTLRATGAWDLTTLWDSWTDGGLAAVQQVLADSAPPPGEASRERPAGRAGRSLPARPPVRELGGGLIVTEQHEREAAAAAAAATGLPVGDRDAAPPRRRVLVNPLGAVMSPYADVGTPGQDPRQVPRKLWHASPGSSGR
jgi:error-prone DNA polymerase